MFGLTVVVPSGASPSPVGCKCLDMPPGRRSQIAPTGFTFSTPDYWLIRHRGIYEGASVPEPEAQEAAL